MNTIDFLTSNRIDKVKIVIIFSIPSDVDECSADLSPCDENTNCINNDGSYICTCNQGFSGDGKTCEGNEYDLYF